uniref:Receptor-type tyrosine-protein phosphatase beta-like n=1 Tax=Phallusia mammillata TaxID=59560 RepID=A0A6F9DPC4_9ASCI|nr:receptor-type tyrosine-protein phosphatase beta-like [Phallusia mammillata]
MKYSAYLHWKIFQLLSLLALFQCFTQVKGITSISITNETDKDFVVSWAPATGSKFRVFVQSGAIVKGDSVFDDGTEEVSPFLVSSITGSTDQLSPNTVYGVEVHEAASDSTNTSATANVTTNVGQLIVAPTITSFTVDSIAIRWNEITNATTYRVTWNSGSDETTALSYTIKPLDASTLYNITVAGKGASDKYGAESPVLGAETVPAAPTLDSVTQTSGAETKNLTVKWTKNGGDSIKFYTLNGLNTTVTKQHIFGTSSYTEVVGGLTPGQEYTVFVTATNDVGTSTSSNSLTNRTNPDKPYNVTASPTEFNTQLNVSWAYSGFANNFTVNIYVNGTVSKTVHSLVNGMVIDDLTPGQEYTVTVTSVSGNILSIESNPSNPVRTNPNPPTDLSTGSTTSTTVNLTWKKPADGIFDGYVLYRNKTLIKTINDNTTESTLAEKLEENAYHGFTLQSTSGNQTSVDTTVAVGITKPGVVTNVNATRGPNKTVEVQVSFDPPNNGATTYTATTISDDGSSNTPHSNNEPPITVSGLFPGQTYSYEVFATGPGGNGNVTTGMNQITTAPFPVADLMLYNSSNTYLFVQWTLPTYGIFDGVVVGHQTSELTKSSQPLPNNTTSYKISGLTPGAQYTITVTTVSNNVNSDIMEITNSTGAASVPGLNATSQTTNSIFITWQKPNGTVTGFRVTWSPVDIYFTTTDTKSSVVNESTVSFNITGLSPGNLYSVSIQSRSTDNKYSSPTTDHFPTTPLPVNITAVQSVSTSTVNISWTEPVDGNYTNFIIRAFSNGNLAQNLTTDNTTTTVSIPNLTPGTYFNIEVVSEFYQVESEIASKQRVPTYPDLVANLTVPATVNGINFNVTWDPPVAGSSENYNVSINDTVKNQVTSEIVNNTTYITNTLIQGTKYVVQVSSVFGGLTGDSVSKTSLLCKYKSHRLS